MKKWFYFILIGLWAIPESIYIVVTGNNTKVATILYNKLLKP